MPEFGPNPKPQDRLPPQDQSAAQVAGDQRPKGRSRGIQIAAASLIAALAFAFVAQSRDAGTEDFSNVRSEELVELLRSLDSSNKRLDDQIGELTATRDELRSTKTRTEAATAAARKRADALAILAGTVPVRGPGITITVEDPEQRVSAAEVLDAIEELRNADAEVIAVNGSARIVGSSFVVSSDSGIRIDGRSLQPPYVIEAIGETGTLHEAVDILGGLVDSLERVGAEVDVKKEDLITITALADAKDAEYARPES